MIRIRLGWAKDIQILSDGLLLQSDPVFRQSVAYLDSSCCPPLRVWAMALAKELTNHSLPEIGREFGGRDHTTVMHACKAINKLRESESGIQEDYTNLTRKLSS